MQLDLACTSLHTEKKAKLAKNAAFSSRNLGIEATHEGPHIAYIICQHIFSDFMGQIRLDILRNNQDVELESNF